VTTKRRLLICLIATLLLVPVVSWIVLREAIKPEAVRDYERLRLGMTVDEISDTIDMSTWDYDSLPSSWIELRCIREAGLPSDYLRHRIGSCWHRGDYLIWAVFDEDGKAVGLYLCNDRRQPSLLDRLRQFIGL
jgi:hypothetical protein